MDEPHLEICKDCDNPMDNCRCEDWMAEDDASKPAASPVAGVSALELLADVMHLWVDGYISKAPDSSADDSVSGEVFAKAAHFLTTQGIEVDYCGWHRVAQPSAEGDGWIAMHNPTNKGDQMKTEVETVTDLLDRFVEVYGEVPLRGSMQEPGMQLWRDYYAWTGDHMILSDEGWEPGEVKQSYLNEYGPDAILDEVNAPLPAPVAKEGRES